MSWKFRDLWFTQATYFLLHKLRIHFNSRYLCDKTRSHILHAKTLVSLSQMSTNLWKCRSPQSSTKSQHYNCQCVFYRNIVVEKSAWLAEPYLKRGIWKRFSLALNVSLSSCKKNMSGKTASKIGESCTVKRDRMHCGQERQCLNFINIYPSEYQSRPRAENRWKKLKSA